MRPIIFALLRRPRLRCLTILMKSSRKPTMPQPTNRKSSSSAEADGRVEGDQLGEEVAEHRGQHDDDAAHGGGAALGVVAGRSVVADLLAVAEVGERPDRHPGPEQREEQRQATARAGSLSPAPFPFLQQSVGHELQGGAPRCLDQHDVVGRDILAHPRQRLVTPRRATDLTPPAGVRRGALGQPGARSPRRRRAGRRPASAAWRPTSRWASPAPSPSSSISPSTATVRPGRWAPIWTSASIAAVIEAGLAL